MVKKVIINLDSLKKSGPVIVLKNSEPELSYLLAELFHMCLKESCFPDWWSHWWSLYLKMLENGLQVKTTTLLVFFLWLIHKVLKKLVNNRIVDHLEKYGLFSGF